MEKVNVVNISKFNLTVDHFKVLSKGLTFCPSTHFDWFQLELDLVQFF